MTTENRITEHMSISNASNYIKGLCMISMKCFDEDFVNDAETWEAYNREEDIMYPIVEDEIEL
jgi:hypothetical protein